MKEATYRPVWFPEPSRADNSRDPRGEPFTTWVAPMGKEGLEVLPHPLVISCRASQRFAMKAGRSSGAV